MIRRAAILGLLFFAVPVLHAGEVLDGIAVTVNGRVILQSDWQDEVRYECFVAGRPLGSATAQDRKDALDRLIDQELLREQMTAADLRSASPDDIEKQFEVMKSDYARDHGANSWDSALIGYRLTEADMRNHIALEIVQLRLVDSHLRPAIQVDSAAIEAYYKEHLATEVAGAQAISLKEATPKIRELLTQEKMNQLLATWLESLHSQAQIKMFAPDSSVAQGPAQ
jgi:peptidyl-prolyl cis-trans isomerase SurA